MSLSKPHIQIKAIHFHLLIYVKLQVYQEEVTIVGLRIRMMKAHIRIPKRKRMKLISF